MRRAAIVFGVNRKTIKRKVSFLAQQARAQHKDWLKNSSLFEHIQFDDLETFEHTKCKPLTVTLFVDPKKRKILGHTVARISAKGKLTAISLKKYGKRKNESFKKRDELFKDLKPFIAKGALIQSDMSSHYINPIKKHFPCAQHKRFKGKRSCVTGQGEMKKAGFDPLFSLNHTFAMIRDNLKRLARRSWCTTKKLEALDDHIALYTSFHNQVLTE